MPDYIGTQNQTGFPAQNRFPVTNTPWGAQRTYSDPTQIFVDTFDASIDLNQWTLTNGGGGVLPAYSGASATLNSGVTLNGFSKMTTVPLFGAEEPAWVAFAARLNIEFPVLATGYRFWGYATTPGSPSIASPITDAVGFEISTTGQLFAVTYASGTRRVIADLSVSTGNGAQPQDSRAHKYYIWFRPDVTFWAIDQFDNIVAMFTSGALGPDVNNLPMTYVAVSNAGTAVTLINNGCSIGDTGRNNVALSDATYPWREMKLLPGGELPVTNSIGSYPQPTNIAYSATTDTAFSAANTSRRQYIVSNDTTAKLYVLIDPSGAAAASATNFTYVIAPGGTFEMPIPVSTARVRGFWAAGGAGTAAVTDISATTTLGGG